MNVYKLSLGRLFPIASLSILFITVCFGCKKNNNQVVTHNVPEVTTAELKNITSGGATCGGQIVNDGGNSITASGIVWSKTNLTPTLKDSVISTSTVSGSFTIELSLDRNSAYYIRAFATNSIGTGYGQVVTFYTTVDTNKVRFVYNGEEVEYGIIVSPVTGRKWLDRNLGAKQVATAYDDYNAYGDLFQWGRPADGHQLINWTSSSAGTPVNGTTTVVATSDIPGHSDFILPHYPETSLWDWRSDNNSNRWVTNPQGPCPAGWHVPASDEWKAEVSKSNGGTALSGGITDRITAFNMLKLTSAGYRNGGGAGPPDEGKMMRAGDRGHYWCSTDKIASLDNITVGESFIVDLGSMSNAYVQYELKDGGQTVRCTKNL